MANIIINKAYVTSPASNWLVMNSTYISLMSQGIIRPKHILVEVPEINMLAEDIAFEIGAVRACREDDEYVFDAINGMLQGSSDWYQWTVGDFARSGYLDEYCPETGWYTDIDITLRLVIARAIDDDPYVQHLRPLIQRIAVITLNGDVKITLQE